MYIPSLKLTAPTQKLMVDDGWKITFLLGFWPFLNQGRTVSFREVADSIHPPKGKHSESSSKIWYSESSTLPWKTQSPTVDGKNPAPPGMYKTLQKSTGINYSTYQLVQDFFHQQQVRFQMVLMFLVGSLWSWGFTVTSSSEPTSWHFRRWGT